MDLIDWPRIEEALLETCRALPSNPTVNMLAEMLLRQLGTERPRAMLDDMWQEQRWIAGKDKETRFQTVGALLVALLLVSPVTEPHLADVLSTLQEYTTLKTLYIEERSIPGGGNIELQTVVKNTMLAQVQGSNRVLSARKSEQQGLSALVSWVNAQHEGIPQLREIFATRELLEHVLLSRMQPSHMVDALYKRGTLLGYPDEISGEDSYYLFAAQGSEIAYTTFIEALDYIDYRRLQVVAFPDREKLIYLHIHRVRQIFSQEDSAAGESQNTSDSRNTRAAGTSSVETGHQEE